MPATKNPAALLPITSVGAVVLPVWAEVLWVMWSKARHSVTATAKLAAEWARETNRPASEITSRSWSDAGHLLALHCGGEVRG